MESFCHEVSMWFSQGKLANNSDPKAPRNIGQSTCPLREGRSHFRTDYFKRGQLNKQNLNSRGYAGISPLPDNFIPAFFEPQVCYSCQTVTPSLVSDGGGLVGWPMTTGEFEHLSEERLPTPCTPPPGHASPTNRLKRLTNTDSVYTMCQTPDGPKFQCAMCARIFNLKCTLLRHVRHQHQGRFVPHPCKTCGQVFKRTDHLKVHMKKIHNLTVQNSQPHTTVQTIVATQANPAIWFFPH